MDRWTRTTSSLKMAAQLPNSAETNPHTTIPVHSDNPQPHQHTILCIRSDLNHQLFKGPELGKLLLTFDLGAFVAIAIASFNNPLPKSYLYAITILLFTGFFALLVALFIHRAFPKPAETLGLIGSASVVTVIPVTTAAFLPKLGFLVLTLSLLLLLISVFCFHRKRSSDALGETVTEAATVAPAEAEVERTAATVVKPGSEEDVKVRWANKNATGFLLFGDAGYLEIRIEVVNTSGSVVGATNMN